MVGAAWGFSSCSLVDLRRSKVAMIDEVRRGSFLSRLWCSVQLSWRSIPNIRFRLEGEGGSLRASLRIFSLMLRYFLLARRAFSSDAVALAVTASAMVIGWFRSTLCRFSKYGLLGGHSSRTSFRIGVSSHVSSSDFRNSPIREFMSIMRMFEVRLCTICREGVLTIVEGRFLFC